MSLNFTRLRLFYLLNNNINNNITGLRLRLLIWIWTARKIIEDHNHFCVHFVCGYAVWNTSRLEKWAFSYDYGNEAQLCMPYHQSRKTKTNMITWTGNGAWSSNLNSYLEHTWFAKGGVSSAAVITGSQQEASSTTVPILHRNSLFWSCCDVTSCTEVCRDNHTDQVVTLRPLYLQDLESNLPGRELM